ncbi:MAG: hypothetical protein IJJ33_13750 [Victivallales bacterium]|nr:hypothetical protein [Victivallales bacterium]
MEHSSPSTHPCIVTGLGKTGCEVASSLSRLGDCRNISLLGVDTDAEDLGSFARQGLPTLLAGQEATGGHGVQSDSELATACIADLEEEILDRIAGHGLAILVAGVGGCTGSCCEQILKVAEQLAIPAVLLAVEPFSFEADSRQKRAEECLNQCDMYCQAIVLAPNQRIFKNLEQTPAASAFAEAIAYLGEAATALTTPFSASPLLNMNPGLLGSLTQDGTPRCHLAVACGDGDALVAQLLQNLKSQPVFQETQLLASIDHAVALLRVRGTCRQADLENALTQLRLLLPDCSIETAACLDQGMKHEMSLTLLLHPSLEFDQEGNPQKNAWSAKDGQLQLQFPADERGIFSNDPPNLYNGSDLDIPTFLRRHCTIDRGY